MQRVKARIGELFDLAPGENDGACRLAYSPAEAQAMLLAAGWIEEAGLEAKLDRYGNLWGLPPNTSGPLITSGSHVDTVPDGGRFDGALGTILAIEAVEALSGPFGVLVCAGVEFATEQLSFAEPVTLDRRLTDLVEDLCEGLGVPAVRCESMAGHDVQHLAERIPATLLFVPSTNGVSHAPQEEVDWKDVECALKVLVALLSELLRTHQTKEAF